MMTATTETARTNSIPRLCMVMSDPVRDESSTDPCGWLLKCAACTWESASRKSFCALAGSRSRSFFSPRSSASSAASRIASGPTGAEAGGAEPLAFFGKRGIRDGLPRRMQMECTPCTQGADVKRVRAVLV